MHVAGMRETVYAKDPFGYSYESSYWTEAICKLLSQKEELAILMKCRNVTNHNADNASRNLETFGYVLNFLFFRSSWTIFALLSILEDEERVLNTNICVVRYRPTNDGIQARDRSNAKYAASVLLKRAM